MSHEPVSHREHDEALGDVRYKPRVASMLAILQDKAPSGCPDKEISVVVITA